MARVQTALLAGSRWRAWEPVVWLLAFAAPWLASKHALIVNEVAIMALFALSLDLILGYAGIVSLGHAAYFGVGTFATVHAMNALGGAGLLHRTEGGGHVAHVGVGGGAHGQNLGPQGGP